MSRAEELQDELQAIADPEVAGTLAWFFKTGKGQYGEGDRFIGIRIPTLRRVAARYRDLALEDLEVLLRSPIHEHRMAAVEILVWQFERAANVEQKRIFDFYLAHSDVINNWDLVDASAPYIVGEYLLSRSHRRLERLAKSKDLWERRIAIVATFAFIRKGELETTFRLSEILLSDTHDLIHKAVGWALREAGKTSPARLLHFLERHYPDLPRTTLRYAIERFPPQQRKAMLQGSFANRAAPLRHLQ